MTDIAGPGEEAFTSFRHYWVPHIRLYENDVRKYGACGIKLWAEDNCTGEYIGQLREVSMSHVQGRVHGQAELTVAWATGKFPFDAGAMLRDQGQGVSEHQCVLRQIPEVVLLSDRAVVSVAVAAVAVRLPWLFVA